MSKDKFYDSLPENECYCDLSLQGYAASEQCATCHRNVYRLQDWSLIKRRDLIVHSTSEFYLAEQGDCPFYL